MAITSHAKESARQFSSRVQPLGETRRHANYTARLNPIRKVLDFVQDGGTNDYKRRLGHDPRALWYLGRSHRPAWQAGAEEPVCSSVGDGKRPLVARLGGIPLERKRQAVLVDRQPQRYRFNRSYPGQRRGRDLRCAHGVTVLRDGQLRHVETRAVDLEALIGMMLPGPARPEHSGAERRARATSAATRILESRRIRYFDLPCLSWRLSWYGTFSTLAQCAMK